MRQIQSNRHTKTDALPLRIRIIWRVNHKVKRNAANGAFLRVNWREPASTGKPLEMQGIFDFGVSYFECDTAILAAPCRAEARAPRENQEDTTLDFIALAWTVAGQADDTEAPLPSLSARGHHPGLRKRPIFALAYFLRSDQFGAVVDSDERHSGPGPPPGNALATSPLQRQRWRELS